ncbi:hypothetical protein F5X99DRAFT_425104 [Biscogniauxia marginata]|nr:hypothetical protein F5X99DRAFT_425104 [Biscogniauxia marginata]
MSSYRHNIHGGGSYGDGSHSDGSYGRSHQGRYSQSSQVNYQSQNFEQTEESQQNDENLEIDTQVDQDALGTTYVHYSNDGSTWNPAVPTEASDQLQIPVLQMNDRASIIHPGSISSAAYTGHHYSNVSSDCLTYDDNESAFTTGAFHQNNPYNQGQTPNYGGYALHNVNGEPKSLISKSAARESLDRATESSRKTIERGANKLKDAVSEAKDKTKKVLKRSHHRKR